MLNLTPYAVFNSFWEAANQRGANSFSFENVKHKADTTFISLRIYLLSETELESNFDLYPENMVYVMGTLDSGANVSKLKLNDNKVFLKPMKYLVYQNEMGEEVEVGVGGFLGSKICVKGREKRLPQHSSLSGFSLGPGTFNNSVGLSLLLEEFTPLSLILDSFWCVCCRSNI
jgi:hypothetical protein